MDDEIVEQIVVVVGDLYSLYRENMVCSQFLAKIFVVPHLVIHYLPHILRQLIVAVPMSFDLLQNNAVDLKVAAAAAAPAAGTPVALVVAAAAAVALELRLLSMLPAFAVQKKNEKKKTM